MTLSVPDPLHGKTSIKQGASNSQDTTNKKTLTEQHNVTTENQVVLEATTTQLAQAALSRLEACTQKPFGLGRYEFEKTPGIPIYVPVTDVTSDPVRTSEILNWSIAELFPALKSLAESNIQDFSGLINAARSAPVNSKELESIVTVARDEIVRLPDESKKFAVIPMQIVHDLNIWFSKQNLLLTTRNLNPYQTSTDYFSGLEIDQIVSKWSYKLFGIPIPTFAVNPLYPEIKPGVPIAQFNPLGIIVLDTTAIEYSSEEPWKDHSPWRDTTLHRIAAKLHERIRTEYNNSDEYFQNLLAVILLEEIRHAIDVLAVKKASGRQKIFFDGSFNLKFLETRFKNGSLLKGIADDVLSGTYDKRVPNVKGLLSGSLLELVGQLSAASAPDPKVRLSFWLAYLQQSSNPLPLHTICSAFGTKLVADQWLSKKPEHLMSRTNWLQQINAIEPLCEFIGLLSDKPTHELRLAMKNVAQNFETPIDGGIFYKITEKGKIIRPF